MAIRDLVQAFRLPQAWPITIQKPKGSVTIEAGELVRRIEKRYG